MLEIFCPSSKEELHHLTKFLYNGEICCAEKFDSLKIQENLHKIFGFPKNLGRNCQKKTLQDVYVIQDGDESDKDKVDMDCLSEIAKESETGQGLRCSIARCGKLFQNDRLLRQHVKHYHPKVYDGMLHKHPQLGDDISEPTSPEAGRRLSDSNDFFHDSYP